MTNISKNDQVALATHEGISRTPTRNAPKQEKHSNAPHDTLPNDRARLMRSRLVDSVHARRAKRTSANDAAREAVDGARVRVTCTGWCLR